MIRFKSGDLLAEDAEALVNAVNCVGVMGRGIAKQFKNAFPANFRAYATACRNREVRPGRMFVFDTGSEGNPRYILNFPTKRHWRGNSRIEDIEAGLTDLVREIVDRRIRSIALPALGSGHGGLEWQTVRRLIEDTVSCLQDVEIAVFEPIGAPGRDTVGPRRDPPRMTAGRAAMIGLMDRYLDWQPEPVMTEMEVQRLMYFMEFSGQDLGLRFDWTRFGPYAGNLRMVLKTVEGHFISGYDAGADPREVLLTLVPGAAGRATGVLQRSHDMRRSFDEVAALIRGFESPSGLDLLATVHWVLNFDISDSLEELVERTHKWMGNDERFSSSQISLAKSVLEEGSWVS